MADRIIALVGKPGAGKTTLGRKVSSQTDWPLVSIDDCGPAGSNRWPKMLARIADTDGTVLTESCVVPPVFRALLERTDHKVIEITVGEAKRRARVRRRGDAGMDSRRVGYSVDSRVRSDAKEPVAEVIAVADPRGGTPSEGIGHRPPPTKNVRTDPRVLEA
jgi:dephospho-CoA kinase